MPASQLERHVESRQLVDGIRFGTRKVVNAVTTLLDEAVELLDSRLPAVIKLARGARLKATGANGEDQRAKGLGVFVIEGTVDEDVIGRDGRRSGQSSIEGQGLEVPNHTADVIQGDRGALGDRLKHLGARQGAASQRDGSLGLDPAGGLFLCLQLHRRMVRSIVSRCKGSTHGRRRASCQATIFTGGHPGLRACRCAASCVRFRRSRPAA
jgi:hypothetical protein